MCQPGIRYKFKASTYIAAYDENQAHSLVYKYLIKMTHNNSNIAETWLFQLMLVRKFLICHGSLVKMLLLYFATPSFAEQEQKALILLKKCLIISEKDKGRCKCIYTRNQVDCILTKKPFEIFFIHDSPGLMSFVLLILRIERGANQRGNILHFGKWVCNQGCSTKEF